MTRRDNILVVIGSIAFVGLVIGTFYQKEIRIAYHRNRLWTSVENYQLLGPNLGNPRSRTPTIWEQVKFNLFRTTDYKEQEAMYQHEEALLKLGYLEKREFWLTNRICVNTDGNLWTALRPEVNKTFDAGHWMRYYFPETNKFQVIATPADMPKWERLISDFDR